MSKADGIESRTQDVLAAKINRRSLLRRSVTIGASLPVVAGLITACGGEDDASDAGASSEPEDEEVGEEVGEEAAEEAAEEEEDDASANADEWTIALTEEPTGFDASSQPFTFSNFLVEGHILEPLVDIQGEDLETVPILAESWEIKDDTTWEFQLREDVTWHNGDEFTAEDVKWTIERLQQSSGGRAYMVSAFTSVEAPDPRTVVINTDEPYGPMLFQLSEIVILPQNAWEEMGGEEFNVDPVGTGPYRMVEWVRDERIIMERNPDWWRGDVSPDRLVFRPITDPTTRVSELRAGGVDIIQSVPAAELEPLNEGDTTVVNIGEGRLMIYPFNMGQPPFDDVRVRQAILFGTDRAEIVETLLGEYGTLLTGPFTSKWMGFNPDVELYPYEPERAQALLAEAGYDSLEFTWNVTDGVFLRDREIAEAIANQLSQIGVTVNLQTTERARIQQDHQASEFQLTSVAWATATDSDAMLQSIVVSRQHNTDDEAKALIASARNSVDTEERVSLYQQVHERMAEQAHWLYVYSQAETYARRADVDWDGFPTRGSIAVHLMYKL